ncbi:STAS domain-containing protein [Thermospira aquatica]|uniref:STAS domain-containing protein n=1 Tax=Thermospira aquatica TaxID=2828656 RepID=A0AAX3BDF5_9SPIR|nr:STAS domain-containing protein [Thermospira aquatica]URA10287.1 STAS domain-containing protein [Thermospira aquatica]
MKYELSDYNGKTLLKIKENLVTDPDAREFKEVLTNLIDSGKKEIIIDFTDMVFIGSSGIGKLLLAYKRLDDMGGKLYVTGLNKDIRDLFVTFRLNEFFQIVDDLSQIK